MITDVFLRRYPEFKLEVSNAFFVQLFNLYDDHNIGIHGAIVEKIQNYPYSNYANEHIRIIAQSEDKLSNELGYKDLDKPQYVQPNYGFNSYRIFKNYIFDEAINSLEKISFFEILFRDAENLLMSEIEFLKVQIPLYEARSTEIVDLSKKTNANYHNDGKEKLDKALPQLEKKKLALEQLRAGINQRLKLHRISLTYHNGYFQNSDDLIIEDKITNSFWHTVSDPKYKNVETDILEAFHRYDTGDRDPAFYAAKALESMIKIICDDKGLTKGNEKGAADFINHLNSHKNGSIIMNHEKEELLSLFRIRNSHGGHGTDSKPMETLTSFQTLRFIQSAMVWINNLSKR